MTLAQLKITRFLLHRFCFCKALPPISPPDMTKMYVFDRSLWVHPSRMEPEALLGHKEAAAVGSVWRETRC